MKAYRSGNRPVYRHCASAAAIAQQGVEDFYKGRTVSIVMGTGPGGSYDLYGRLVANHFGRHIPAIRR